ncbi:hypothetical protein [uncultured Amnibacterium sp.]|uniref:hypothetical protein n=1 Tax=uncultured Amnibacterium sp. TaxID=1631851 RepID=UPI0035CBF3BE
MSAEREGFVDESDLVGGFSGGDTLTVGPGDHFLDSDELAHPMMRSACGYVSWLDVPVDDGDDA